MYDIKQLENTGTPLDYGDPSYPDVEDAIRGARNGLPITEIRARAHGIIIPLTLKLRDKLEIKPEGEALLWWSDGDPDDPSDGINVIDTKTVNQLTEESAGTIIKRVVAYYKRIGNDDGNPAYALYTREQGATEANPVGERS